jgi:hypothetical protein
MVAKQAPDDVALSDKDLVLSSLEPDQLSSFKRSPIPRRQLTLLQMSILWALRGYLIFMVAVVIYQLWSGTR